jgi:xylulokinase
MRELLLGLDIGTQGVRGILVDQQGRVAAKASIEHSSQYPRPDWCEHDVLENWWNNPVSIIRSMLNNDNVSPTQIAAVSISGIFPVMGPTDSKGVPLRGAILYSDNRAKKEIDELNETLGLNLTGESLTPKLLWFLRNEPDSALKMSMFFDAAHFAIYRLTGMYVIDTITAGLFGAIFDSPSATWRENICEMFGIPVGVLPAVHPPATIVGHIHREASNETGLNVGTPVLAGLPDLAASSISVGVVEPVEAIVYYGTAGVMPILKGRLIDSIWKSFPEQERLPTVGVGFESPQITGPRGISGFVYDYPAYCLSTGDAVRWFRQLFGAQEDIEAEREGGPNVYARLDQLAAQTPPGSDGLLFIPHLQGQRSPDFNPAATGIYFGITIKHTRGHFFRAVLESFGYEICRGLEAHYPEGLALDRVVATGGGAQSLFWLQIVSDITGFQQEYVPIADGALADAYLAGIALGWYDDFKTLKDGWVQVKAVIQPNPENQRVYEEFFPLYCDLHGSVEEPYLKHYRSIQRTGET